MGIDKKIRALTEHEKARALNQEEKLTTKGGLEAVPKATTCDPSAVSSPQIVTQTQITPLQKQLETRAQRFQRKAALKTVELKKLMDQINQLLKQQLQEKPRWAKEYQFEDQRAVVYHRMLKRVGLPEKHARFAPWFHKSDRIKLTQWSKKLFDHFEKEYVEEDDRGEHEKAIQRYQEFIEKLKSHDLDPWEINQITMQKAFRSASFKVQEIDIYRKKKLGEIHPALREPELHSNLEMVDKHGGPVGFAKPVVGKLHSEGKHLYFTYFGKWKNGHMHGDMGVYKFADGGKYVGSWRNSKPNGSGVAEYPNGAKYSGSWENGKYHGNGVMEYPDLTNYTGEFKDGKRHGKGKIVFPSGSWYEGSYFLGHRHGYGKAESSTGFSYVGEWMQSRIHGSGMIVFPTGKRFRREDWSSQTFGEAIQYAKIEAKIEDQLEYLDQRLLLRVRDDLRVWDLHKAYRIRKKAQDEENERLRKEKLKKEFKEKREAQEAAKEAFLREKEKKEKDDDRESDNSENSDDSSDYTSSEEEDSEVDEDTGNDDDDDGSR